ncbi:SNARE associated Golgi protein [uncultured archaeon]|nr:SNARE associated Golgi protein [uncultured archaeon]
MFEFVTQLYDVNNLILWGGYLIIAIIIFSETGLLIGFFLPGDSLLVTAGLFAAKGDLNIILLNLILIPAAVIGDALNYRFGFKVGGALFKREDSRFFKKKHVIKAKNFYEKHGGKTIIIARFVPVVRTFAPMVAGIAEMKYRKFFLFNVIGATLWIITMTMAGYLLGSLIPNIDKNITYVALAVIVISFIPLIVEYFRHRKKKNEIKN